MDLQTAEFIAQALIDEGYEASVSDYSGRGMFGRKTSGVITDAWPVTASEIYGAIKSKLDDAPSFTAFSTDAMGKGTVIY